MLGKGFTLENTPPGLRQLLVLFTTVVFVWLFIAGFKVTTEHQPELVALDTFGYLTEQKNTPFNVTEIVELDESHWQSTSIKDFSSGLSDDAFWFKIKLPRLKDDGRWIVELGYPLLDDIQLWIQSGQQFDVAFKTGDGLPFVNRPVLHNQFLFPFDGNSDQQQTLYLRIKTSSAVNFPLKLWSSEQYIIFTSEFNLLIGLFFGTLLAMGLNNLFFWAATGGNTFLSYAGYVICIALSLFANIGYGFKYLWPNLPQLQHFAVLILGFLTIYFGVTFTYYFLDLKALHRRFGKFIKVTSWVLLALTLSTLLMSYSSSLKLLLATLVWISTSCLLIGFWCLKQRNPFARTYVFAWSFVLIGGVVYAMAQTGIITIQYEPHMIFILASSAECVIFAFALALHYHRQREASLSLQKQQQSSLKTQVEERTWELEIALRELAESNRQLEKLSTVDALTNCHNRRYFDKKLLAETRRSRRLKSSVALAMLDLDYFKSINDSYGHPVGDKCLRQVANLIKNQLQRETDLLFRYGGEEFAILMPATDPAGCLQVLNKIRQSIKDFQFNHEGHTFNVTVSIGFCCCIVDQNVDEHQLLSVADQALFFAKRQGRNTIIEQSIDNSDE